jgi:RimJ/RimL family protein N-acetyltransferase
VLAVRHDFALRGFAFGLRPVEAEDAAFLVRLRTQPGRSRLLNRGAETVEAQRQWLETYFSRPGDYYFAIYGLADGTQEGAMALYNVDEQARSAEWGRWILRAGSVAAVESAVLLYRFAFHHLRLQRVHCRTLKENTQVVSFHDSCGLAREPSDVMVEFDGSPTPAVEHYLTVSEWPAIERRLDALARRIATRIVSR